MPASRRTYTARRDLSRRMRWLFASKRGAASTDLELALDPERAGGAPIIIPVHRCILAAGSEGLRVMLNLQLQLQDEQQAAAGGGAASRARLVLSGTSLPTAAAVLRFLYTGEARFDSENTLDIHLASERLGLLALRQLAEHMLPHVVREDNVCAILRDAFANRLPSLAAFASAYALRHFDALVDWASPPAHSTQFFAQLQAALGSSAAAGGFLGLSRPVLVALLLSDDLCVASEEKVLRAVLMWGLANMPTGARLYTSDFDASEGAERMLLGPTSSSAAALVRSQATSVATAAAGGAALQSSSIATAAGAGAGAAFYVPTLQMPPVPVSAVPALKSLLGEVFPAVRFQLLDYALLRSPVVAALVSSDILLSAMFAKAGAAGGNIGLGGPGAFGPEDLAQAALASGLASQQAWNNPALFGGDPSSFGGGAGGGGGGASARSLYLPPDSRPSLEAPRILSLGTLIDDQAQQGRATVPALLAARRGATATAGYLSSRSSDNTPFASSSSSSSSSYFAPPGSSAPSILAPSGPYAAEVVGHAAAQSAAGPARGGRGSYYDTGPDPAAYSSVDLDMAAALAAEVSGGYGSDAALRSAWQQQQLRLLSVAGTRGVAPVRRYAEIAAALRPLAASASGFAAPPNWTLRFDAFMAGTASLANMARTVAFVTPPEPVVVSGMPAAASAAATAAVLFKADGSRGAVLVSAVPCVGLAGSAMPAAEPTLPAGPVYSFDLVLEDSASLLDVDPEAAVGESAAATGGGDDDVGHFELALCLLPAGSAHSALISGVRSGDPAAYGALWVATNRGEVFRVGVENAAASAPVASAFTAASVAVAASAATGATPHEAASVAAAAVATAPAQPPQLGPLTRVATGLRFGVSSSLSLSIDSATGDVGFSVSNIRVGFDAHGDFDGAGWDAEEEQDDDVDDENEESDSSARARRSGGRGAAFSAPRCPPPPFQLVPRVHVSAAGVAGAATQEACVLHSPDPSLGPLAFVHAASCRLPLASIRAAGLQLCVLARTPSGLVATLVPSLRLSS